MKGKNKVNLLGRVGQDAKVTSLSNGGQAARFSLATTDQWRDNNGNKQEKTTWHNVVAYGQTAGKLGAQIRKGTLVDVEGKINNYEYEKDGQKRYGTEIVLKEITFLSPKQEGGSRSSGGSQQEFNDMPESEIAEEPMFADEDEH